LEADCAKEKLLLTNLASRFQLTINKFFDNSNINNFCVNWVKDTPEFKELEAQINNCAENVMNKEIFEIAFLKK
jgi:hypothetical protein